MENENNVDNVEVQDTNNENVEAETKEVKAEKSFSQEDLDRILSKKFAQWERKSEQKAKEIEEAEKLKRMSETERQQAEMKKQLEEYNKMKSEMAREKLSNQVVKELASRSLPCEYAEYIMVEGDAEATMERLSTFAEKYNSDVQKEVDRLVHERLRGKTPQSSTVEVKSSFTAEDVRNMSASEINKNWEQIKNIKLN